MSRTATDPIVAILGYFKKLSSEMQGHALALMQDEFKAGKPQAGRLGPKANKVSKKQFVQAQTDWLNPEPAGEPK